MTRLRRPVRQTPPETLIALVDVVFFLLVFFMLIGRLDATAPFRVTPPVSELGTDLPGGGATVSVAADGTLGGYAYGSAIKTELLRRERGG